MNREPQNDREREIIEEIDEWSHGQIPPSAS
jgi:hypothetical protein